MTVMQNAANTVNSRPAPPRMVAVIDIGTTSIRMAVAELHEQGRFHTIENLVQPVDLGRDAFQSRRLSRKGIERAAEILRHFRRVLDEYGVVDPSDIRVVATSAVQEATNRVAFIDRVYVATGLDVEPIDEAEVNRITYMGITPLLLARDETAEHKSIVMEIGGGSTELLVIRGGNVLHSDAFRLGSLRLLQSLEATGVHGDQWRQLLETHLRRIVVRIADDIKTDNHLNLVALGSDIRFAVHHLVEGWDGESLVPISVDRIAGLANEILELEPEAMVDRYGVAFVDTETSGPTLLAYTLFARQFGIEELLVGGTNLRDGLLRDMSKGGNWTSEFRQQIIRSAMSVARKFDVEEIHARAVADLAQSLFSQLQNEHSLDPRYEVLLYVAALLHEVGLFVNVHSNHKHAYYLIRNTELFGLSQHELLLVALVARYHRRASPNTRHDGYGSLALHDRVAVAKLSAIMRLAIALDDTRSGRLREIQCSVEDKRLVITIPGVEDVSLEQIALRTGAGLFRDVFGKTVMLRPVP